MALGHIDYYVLKPWSTPDELFHRLVSEFLHEWRRQNAPGRRELTVVADPWSPRGYELRNLLARNGVPHAFHTCDSTEGVELLRDVRAATEPTCRWSSSPDGVALVDPTAGGSRAARDAHATELDEPGDVRRRDRRRGPGRARGGGLRVVGGVRARSSSSASRSAARRGRAPASATTSASRGAQRRRARAARVPAGVGLRRDVPADARGDGHRARRHDAHACRSPEAPRSRRGASILAMGVSYRRLEVPALAALDGSGVFYGSSPSEARQFTGGDVFVVGGGNSAGQAAIHLARYAANVTLLCRGAARERACRSTSRRDRGEGERRRSARDGGRRRRRATGGSSR